MEETLNNSKSNLINNSGIQPLRAEQYDEFMLEYYEQHKYCPKCGSEKHITTLVGYCLDLNKKEEYKDMDRSECVRCGNVHSVHDRVP